MPEDLSINMGNILLPMLYHAVCRQCVTLVSVVLLVRGTTIPFYGPNSSQGTQGSFSRYCKGIYGPWYPPQYSTNYCAQPNPCPPSPEKCEKGSDACSCTVNPGTRICAPVVGTATIRDGGRFNTDGTIVDGTITATVTLTGTGNFGGGETILGGISNPDGVMTDGSFMDNATISNGSLTAPVTVNGTVDLAEGSVITGELAAAGMNVFDGSVSPGTVFNNVTVNNGIGTIQAGSTLANASGATISVTNGVDTVTLAPGSVGSVFGGTLTTNLLSSTGTATATTSSSFVGLANGAGTFEGRTNLQSGGATASLGSMTDPARIVEGTLNVNSLSQFVGQLTGDTAVQDAKTVCNGTITGVTVTENIDVTGEAAISADSIFGGTVKGNGSVDNGTLSGSILVCEPNFRCGKVVC